jgi:hypothetical protein
MFYLYLNEWCRWGGDEDTGEQLFEVVIDVIELLRRGAQGISYLTLLFCCIGDFFL